VWAWALIIAKNKRLAWVAIYFFLSILLSALICDAVKILAGRARPYEFFSFDIYGFYLWQFDNNFWSFPSGHATCIGAVTSACYLTLRRYGKLFLIVFFLVFFGRVITRAHYLSDVMAGGYLGFLASYWNYHFLKPNLERKNKE
jgi:membrane-associated phospholipid phosphatase